MIEPEATRVVAVIVGRAGSKGLPGKNAMLLGGRPMICWSIDHALQAETVDEVVVSTDGPEIAASAESMRVRVVERPPHLASDTATVDSAVRHAVESIRSSHEIVVILYANVPLRPRDLIDRAVRRLVEPPGADSVQSYCDVGKHHPYWMTRLDNAGRVNPFVSNAVYRRQDLPKLFLPDGGVIAVTRRSLDVVIESQPHAFLGSDRRGIVTKPGDVIDIDTAHDLAVAVASIDRTRLSLEAASG